MLKKKKIKAITKLVTDYFKNTKGDPFPITPGQCEIFEAVTNPKYNWVWVSAPTRYGKSDILAMAIIYLAKFHHLRIPIVAGSEDKAKKIMDYITAHIADHPIFSEGLINLNISDIEKLKVTVSKNTLRWSDGGWIFVTSIDSRSLTKEGEGVVGEGGDVVVLEESGLIKDRAQFSKVVRMPEYNNGWGKLVQSGNCVENSVFEDAFKSLLYKKVRIGLDTAVKEGRYTEKELSEKQQQTTSKDWKRYYKVEFPQSNEFTYFKPKKYDVLPNDLKYFGALDPALGDLGKNAKTNKNKSLVGLVVLGVSEKTGQAYEMLNEGLEVGPDEVMRQVFNLPFVFQRFGIEAIQFQKYFLDQIEQRSKELKKYIPFEGIEQKLSKETRIESLEPYVNTGQILFSGNGLLWEHFQEYPNLTQLDVIDTLEMAWRMARGSGFEFDIL